MTGRSFRQSSPLIALAIVLAVLLSALSLGAFRWAQGQAVAVTDAVAAQLARDNAGLLASELQKFRLLPLVLAEYPDARALLESRDAGAVERMNARLALLAQRTDAAAIYIIAPDGRTLAASNYRLPTSFVGQDYGFRPYFRNALRDGGAELFALGTVSGRPGLYLARRIGTRAKPLGVIVVKIEFEPIQTAWAQQPATTLVTDRHGVVIITSRPEWRFGALAPLAREARQAIAATRQYGDLPLAPLPLPGADETRTVTAPLPLDGATLRVIAPLGPALNSANANARLAVLAALVLLAGGIVLMWRARERRAMQAAARQALELEVAERTADLREANARLVAESAERARADRRYRAAREELAQANRLGSLGQITAGVAHEINQPVAAIRSFAENADAYLARGDVERAKGNLARIADLTGRIGTITGELRNFARRRTPEIGAVPVEDALDSTMLLIGDRLRTAGVALARGGDPGLSVIADRVRLEQVLINLIQNALDALEGSADPRIRIDLARRYAMVAIRVADSGPGVPADLRAQLFTPFVTGRDEGLGLGLAIARNIARDFGGELSLVDGPLPGAAFELLLKAAP